MEEYIIYAVPYLLVGLIALATAFSTDNWPEWFSGVAIFNGYMVNGIWASGVVSILLVLLGFHTGLAMILALPVAYFVGRMIVGRNP